MKITISHLKHINETCLVFEPECPKDKKSLRAFANELDKNNHRYGSISVMSKMIELSVPCGLYYRR